MGKPIYLSSIIILILLPQAVNADIPLIEVKNIEIGNYDSIFNYGWNSVAVYSNQSGSVDIYDAENLASPTYVKTLNVSDTPIQGIGTTPGSWFYYLTQNDTHCILTKYEKDSERNTLTRSYSDACYDSIAVNNDPMVVGFHNNAIDVYDDALEPLSSYTMDVNFSEFVLAGFVKDQIYAVYKTDSWKGHTNIGLLAFDISDPTHVSISGSLNVTNEIGTITSAYIVGAYKRVKLIFTETIGINNYAKIFDVYNLNNMKELDTFETGRVTHKQAIQSIYPYFIITSKPVGESPHTIGGIQIYDVDQEKVIAMDASSNLAEPFITDSLFAPSYIYTVSAGLNPHYLKVFHITGLSANAHIPGDAPGSSIFVTSLALLVLIIIRVKHPNNCK